ncbi:unnamed protein product, partial [marine sediment metagenome]
KKLRKAFLQKIVKLKDGLLPKLEPIFVRNNISQFLHKKEDVHKTKL